MGSFPDKNYHLPVKVRASKKIQFRGYRGDPTTDIYIMTAIMTKHMHTSSNRADSPETNLHFCSPQKALCIGFYWMLCRDPLIYLRHMHTWMNVRMHIHTIYIVHIYIYVYIQHIYNAFCIYKTTIVAVTVTNKTATNRCVCLCLYMYVYTHTHT